MALSNMLREPRREITETLVGLLPLVVFFGMDALLARPLRDAIDHTMPMFAAYVIGAIVLGIGGGCLWLIHDIGEAICDYLGKCGLELRPKWRK